MRSSPLDTVAAKVAVLVQVGRVRLEGLRTWKSSIVVRGGGGGVGDVTVSETRLDSPPPSAYTSSVRSSVAGPGAVRVFVKVREKFCRKVRRASPWIGSVCRTPQPEGGVVTTETP